jgi:NADPH2:quinone reductase
MRAVQVVRLDGPDGVEVRDIDVPVAATDEVLVEVHASGLSFPDLLLSQGRYQLKPEVPFIIGIDFAGIVVEVGRGAGGNWAVGDRVAGWGRLGGAAEVVAVSPDALFPLPPELTFTEGACLPLNYLTAHFALLTRGGLRTGETVLVHGAAGGVGTAMIGVAKAFGATVIAVASSEHKRSVARHAGADRVIPAENFGAALNELGTTVDIVVDVVGTEQVVLDSLRLLNVGGRLLSVGFAGGELPSIKLNRLLLNNLDVRGVAWGPFTRAQPGFAQQQWAELLPHLRSGAITPVLGQVYALADVGQALVDLAERRTTGKSVLTLR